ncbi:DUF2490 domain-containing protein [Pontibacter sp. SGAir0037]|uniref:DUF2490 domain-containing protein n=1 Tax=Pontibacter sp. SGAir0037 TaxID=2571030 RepID=UPI0010CCE4A7|nr:DUF2490 domain-containing protein [Pontibacter sp. SGAir0037]QCR22569.1 DUF2490 domain-containing protein [Pontibacter sp. SGAir0037]
MYRGLIICVVVMFVFSSLVQAQKNVVRQDLFWVRYQNQLSLNPKWLLQSEIDNRMFVFPVKEHHLVMRSQIRYTISPLLTAGGGITYALQHPQDPQAEIDLVIPELRGQQDITLKQTFGKLIMNHRYMVEQRFIRKVEDNKLADGYNFNYRLRYRLQGEIPVLKSESHELRLVVHDEVMLNAGKSVTQNVFDQNRIYAGLQYGITPALAVELGYMNWYQQRASGKDFFNRDITRLSIFHKINLQNHDK